MKSQPIKLSLCMGTYNRLKYLKVTLKHLFDELKSISFEIVIADGGSTDGTIEYLQTLDKVVLIEQGSLLGMTKAFKACFEITKGKYIFWLNDHFFVIGEQIIRSCQLMDLMPDVAAVSLKTYITPRVHFKLYHTPMKYLILTESIIYRKRDMLDVDGNYHGYYFITDLLLRTLVSGRRVVCTREISVIDVKITHTDYLHDKGKGEGLGAAGYDYFHRKWSGLEKVIESDLSLRRKIKAQVFRYLLSRFIRLIKSRGFWAILRILSIFGYNPKLFPLIPDIPEEEKPPAFETELDRRHKIPFLERIIDWLYEGTSGYIVKDLIRDKNFYLVQQLPLSVRHMFKQKDDDKATEDRTKS